MLYYTYMYMYDAGMFVIYLYTWPESPNLHDTCGRRNDCCRWRFLVVRECIAHTGNASSHLLMLGLEINVGILSVLTLTGDYRWMCPKSSHRRLGYFIVLFENKKVMQLKMLIETQWYTSNWVGSMAWRQSGNCFSAFILHWRRRVIRKAWIPVPWIIL